MKKNDLKLLETAIGKNNEKLIHKKYSIPAFLFGPLYFAYRKCYFISFIFFIIGLLTGVLFTKVLNLSFLIPLFLLHLSYLYLFPILYKRNISKKIEKYKKDLSILKERGGVSVVGVIFSTILYSLITVCVVVSVAVLWKRQVHTNKLFFDTKGFAVADASGTVFIKQEKDKTCMMQIGPLNETGMHLMQYYYGFKEDFSNMEKETINKKTWYVNNQTSQEENFTTIYLYKEEKKTYIAKFYGKEEKDYALCQQDFNEVKESLKFK
ncbi:MAG: hypothetical protein PHN72_01550 [Bacilli bacterium]|nr:hypothetical protein [Bacilli bacterium]